ncbi:MAG: cbb3-type cytochrome oxidase assembly protein CcoS [Planctomycetaceae bacterium]|nr:cbb3-type cytochrome oxidase assembly protein CcoS [Planctomycetaceae bacterium]MBN8600092.1 cbb3-type cytochrome oxidase assembly protein CcoS [Planctomycetota bacterium]
MSVIYVALPVALIVAGCAVVAFTMSALRGQFDDLTTPPWRILLDDEPLPEPGDKSQNTPVP